MVAAIEILSKFLPPLFSGTIFYFIGKRNGKNQELRNQKYVEMALQETMKTLIEEIRTNNISDNKLEELGKKIEDNVHSKIKEISKVEEVEVKVIEKKVKKSIEEAYGINIYNLKKAGSLIEPKY